MRSVDKRGTTYRGYDPKQRKRAGELFSPKLVYYGS
jgi:hypothetical protein